MDDLEEYKCDACGAPIPPEGWVVMTLPASRQPNLAPWDAAELRSSPELAEYFHEDIAYGESLPDALAASDGFLDYFLVRASFAGHAILATEGICAALLAHHARNVAVATDCLAQGVDADALGAVDGYPYRKVTALLERLTADLEQRAADIHRSPGGEDITPKISALWLQQAEAAERRAMNALRRGVEVEQDTADAAAEGDWYR
jgi:hypothetical protein